MRRLARPALYLGTIAVVLALSKYHARYVANPPYDYTGTFRFGWSILYMAFLVLAAYGAGLPDLPRSNRAVAQSVVGAPVAAALGISLVQLGVGSALLPRFVVFGTALTLMPIYLVCVKVAQGGRARAEDRDRVVLVANHHDAITLGDELEGDPERPAVLVSAMSPEDALPDGPRSKPLCQRVLDMRGTVVVLDRTALAEPAVVSQAANLHENGLRVRTLSGFYDEWLAKLPMSELERASLLFDIRELHGTRYVRVKRMLDMLVGLVGLPIVAASIPFVWIGNRLGNRGPLFFAQERIGKNGRRFRILKFRTMKPLASDQLTTEWTKANDPRVTSFGRVLRKSHVDELPQLVNILKGDLSLVGPRPEQPHYVADLTQKLPFYGLRHLVRPGLTGWAQVKYGYAGDEEDALEKLQYEFWYLGHQSLGLDARIVGRTVRSVTRGGGR